MGILKKISPDTSTTARVPDGTRVYAVGDIHGRLDLLEKLIERIENDAGTTDLDQQVIFLGDYVDRGSDSAGVIDTLIAFGREYQGTIFLRGNHEEAMLDFLADPDSMESWIEWGGLQALESYGLSEVDMRSPQSLRDELAEKLPDDHLRYLLELNLYHEIGDYVFVHAGLRAGTPLEQQSERDILWIREEFHNSRPEDWGNRCVVHGHTPQNKPENISWRINVDTGAFYSGRLTAVVLEGDRRRFIST